MAKRFQFDDEEDIQESGYQKPSYVDEVKEHSSYEKETESVQFGKTIELEDELDDYDEEDDFVKKTKKKKKFVWKWWYYILVGLFVLFIAFMVYIFILSNNDGPVYGNRCQGIATISQENISSAISKVKEEHSEVQDITMEIACKQLKVDIVFKDGMSTKKAKSIAEESVQVLDELVGMEKEEGKTYSSLFGYENNVAQFEVNLFLESTNSDDFPIYGTKHVQNDEFSYTLASVKDEESKEKAQSTLQEE